MKFLILGNFMDNQTGIYIEKSLEELGHEVKTVNIRKILADNKSELEPTQLVVLEEIEKLSYTPDTIIVLKGHELTTETLKKIRVKYKNVKLVNWFFDIYFNDKKIWENKECNEFIKEFDYFFCSIKEASDKLKEVGFNNVYYLEEGCYPPFHKEQYMNNFQKKKYGEDISFCGSIGYSMHQDRIRLLDLIVKEGFNINIWGRVVCEPKSIPPLMRRFLTGKEVVNESHSMVCQTSLINIGIDQDINADMGFSARVYRVLCAGGLYLSTNTKGLDKLFKINKKGEELTKDLEIVVFYDDKDLIEKLDFLLEHDGVREAIAENGQKVVLEKHKFSDRLSEMIGIVKNENKCSSC